MSKKPNYDEELLCEICDRNTPDVDRDYLVIKNSPDSFESLPVTIRLCRWCIREDREITKMIKSR